MKVSRLKGKALPTTEDTTVLDAVNADFGETVEYRVVLSDESAERYAECLDDYVDAHAEAEAGLQDLSAG